MSPAEDAALLLAIVRRHLRTLRFGLAALQVFAVEARYEEGPFPLPASRTELLALLELELGRCERAVVAMG
jgi:hypothetical protein